ncbi:MAG: DUF1015 domain-containing protein [Ignavibacteriales bacterium]|nr:DUF1015 domain-containing protein [Ignavibacteriales bacterium]
MPELQSFNAILYNTKKINLSEVVAPPYDVISLQQQDELYKRSTYNVVRLILGREGDRYKSALRHFTQWREENILSVDDEPALYVLTQTYMLPDGKQVTRRGFIAACRLEEPGKGTIFPHEKTLSKPKEDRLKLFQATETMFSQIFSIYSDPNNELKDALFGITSSRANYEVEFENVLNRVWRLTDATNIQAITDYFRTNNVLIADGHHRYETAFNYMNVRKEQNSDHTGKEAYNFVPMFFTNMNDPGLIILPTHRVVHSVPDFDISSFMQKLEQYFHVTIYSNQNQILKNLPLRKHNFGMILPTALGFILLELKSFSFIKELQIPEPVGRLDVTILHSLILKQILGISLEAQEQKLNLDYEKDSQQAIDAVRDGRAQIAFILNPTPIEQVHEVAVAGYTLPQKSTYFYPKLLSGLVSYSFSDTFE